MPQPTMPAAVRMEQYCPFSQRWLMPRAVPPSKFRTRWVVRGRGSDIAQRSGVGGVSVGAAGRLCTSSVTTAAVPLSRAAVFGLPFPRSHGPRPRPSGARERMRRTILCVSLLGAFVVLAGWVWQSSGVAPPAAAVQENHSGRTAGKALPLTQIVLFNSGVGYFQ